MLEFLEGLQKLQSTDPAEFDKAMGSLLGIPAGAGADAVSSQQKSESLSSMIAGIQSMREGGSGALGGMAAGVGGDGVNITGNKPPEQKGIYITPEPGFVVKTRNTSSNANNTSPSSSALVESSSSSKVVELDDEEGGQKVFINICSHEEVGAPGMKKRLDANGEEQEGMNIPMSVGQGRVGEDKSGGACLVYDIIVNKKVLEECKDDKSGKYRDFVCQLGMQCLEQKFSLDLDRRYKLPKLKYQPAADGKVDQQYIKDRKSSPQIEEVRILFYCSSFLFLFVCDVSVSLSGSITACLHSLTLHDTSLTSIPSSINHQSTHTRITYYLTGSGEQRDGFQGCPGTVEAEEGAGEGTSRGRQARRGGSATLPVVDQLRRRCRRIQ
jgi:hypothetical protein